ncbi:hypothetical protein [Methylocucumis oryzae]|uniref:REase AHJR-like domain-containing protein n=1 Tax=Methylocucumis oryzae TaxID=1632867 RepID=A0A0F3IKV4_9GAMM|nr:hypothetical protein [Methylocucumis oryzae]KJV06189.1 hypothetical protein VZ94_12930 [Methylocucumis oryzae]
MTIHFDSVTEQTIVNSMLQQLQANGYHVTLQPEPETLPFDLGGYRPDLIATNDNEGIIFEVNARHLGISVDKLQELAEKIAQHKGWRFMLVTDEDVANNLEYSTNDNLPSWLALQTKLDTIKNLIQDNMLLEPGLLYLWSLFESMLRKTSNCTIHTCRSISR